MNRMNRPLIERVAERIGWRYTPEMVRLVSEAADRMEMELIDEPESERERDAHPHH